MDQNVDPCEDFYKFACGNWPKNHPVKETELSNTWFAERSQALIRELKDLLKESNENSSDPNAVLQIKSLYKACTDIEQLESLGLEPIMQVLQNVSLPREIPNNETAADWDIATTLALVQKTLSLDSLVQLGPDIDSSNNGKLLLNFAPPSEVPQLIRSLVSDPDVMPKAAHLSKPEALKARITYMIKMLIKMVSWGKNDLEQTNMTSIATTAFKIMLFSAEVTSGVSSEENDTSSAVKITIPDLQKIMDLSTKGAKYDHKINWERYMNVLLGGMGQSFNIGKDIVSVSDIHYFQKLAWLIANSQMETIQRYVWWQVVELLAPHTNKAMRNLRNEMLEKFFGKIQIPSRSTLCLRRVKKLLPMAVSYTKAMQVDFNSTVSKVTEMLNDIKNSFNSLVQEGDWINPETKQAAQEKAEAIASFVGYQDWLLQPGKLDEYYGELELIENQYLLSIIKIKRREVNDFLNQILNKKYGSHKNESWNDIDPLQVNAYYSRTENAIIIPAGILQFPFYGRGLESLNYGSIGSILGHELTHGFDIEGKNYGKDGKRVSWWNTDMLKAYEDRAQCFIEQYNSFGSENYKVNGKQTLAENIADNGGIREAYKAYQKYKERHDPEPYLPGLESFTHEQLLFLAFANIWCIDEGPDYESVAIKDSHSPGRYRVLGSLSNSPEFTETWMCPTNTSGVLILNTIQILGFNYDLLLAAEINKLSILKELSVHITNMECMIILPCGHKCSNTTKTPHLEHKLQKCRKRCKQHCPRNHKCEKLCWEDCEPCKHPVYADLPCKHEALLPCHLIDRYQCQELCDKILCSNGHTCGKECWEECGPCRVPIALKLSCSHHAIIPCYLNDDTFKCREKCGRIQKCEFQHECEKECWENCIPCTNSVRRNLDCGHDVILPCYVDIDKFKCSKTCEKVLCSNNHICRKLCWEDCGPCKYKMGFTLPCSHKVILPCGSNIENYVCRQACETRLCKLGHKCQNQCWENCSKCQCMK